MPDLRTLIDQFHAAEAERPADRPIRVLRVAMLSPQRWDAHARVMDRTATTVTFGTGRIVTFTSRESERCQRLADIGERLSLEYVGRVVGQEAQP